jgi:CPA2 family monovalent cation:H+ antiporter-2
MPILASTGGHAALGLTLFVILATAAVVSAVFKRFKLDAIPGYLIAGAIVGPSALGFVRDAGSVEQVSSLAIILLLFTLGLHMDLGAMRRGMVHIVGIGLASTFAFVGLFWACLTLLRIPRPVGLTIALAASISSTAVLVRTLMARRELQSSYGRVTLGVSIVQDFVSVFILAMLPVLQAWSGGVAASGEANVFPPWADLVFKGLKGVAGIFLMLIGGRFLLPKLLNALARLASQELLLVASAAIALAAAWWTGFVGFSAEMGAFLAGFLLGTTPYRYQLSGQLAPMRDLLMAVFFTTVGLNVDPATIAGNWWLVLAIFAAVVACKFLAVGGSCYVAGMTAPTSFLGGVYLANAGEFTLVIIATARAMGIVSSDQQAVMIAVVILTLVLTPVLIAPSHSKANRFARIPLSPWARRAAALRDGPAPTPPAKIAPHRDDGSPDEGGIADPRKLRHVIIAGYGPVGRTIADRLAVQGVDFTVVELNAQTVQRQALAGKRVVYGDITNHEVLEQAGVHWSDAVVLTLPDEDATLRACQAIRDVDPHIFLAARVKFLSGKFTALQLGADAVVVEEVVTATAMERELFDRLGEHLARRAAGAGH